MLNVINIYKNLKSTIISDIKNTFFDKEINIFFKFIAFCIICLPITLITGPAIPDISVSLIGIFFIYETFNKKLFYLYKRYIIYFFLFFVFMEF